MEREITLVLSGGGARGIAHIGVIEMLLEQGYTITSVAGTSMGALVGGVYAKGSLPEFTNWIRHTTRRDVLKLMDISIGKGGFVKGERIMQAIEQIVGTGRIEDLKIPFSCVAVDLRKHKQVVYRKGSLLESVRASISIPTLFLPVVENETLMVDGGLLNPLPLSAASLKEGSMLVAVDVNAPIEYESPVKTVHDHEREGKYKQALEMMNHRWSQMIGHNHDSAADNHKIKQAGLFEVITESLAIMQEELTKNAILEFKPDLLIEVSRKCASIYDFYKAEELIEAGRHACLAALQKPSHARKEMLGRAV